MLVQGHWQTVFSSFAIVKVGFDGAKLQHFLIKRTLFTKKLAFTRQRSYLFFRLSAFRGWEGWKPMCGDFTP